MSSSSKSSSSSSTRASSSGQPSGRGRKDHSNGDCSGNGSDEEVEVVKLDADTLCKIVKWVSDRDSPNCTSVRFSCDADGRVKSVQTKDESLDLRHNLKKDDDDDGEERTADIICIKRTHFDIIVDWIDDHTDFDTDTEGNVTRLRLAHFPKCMGSCHCGKKGYTLSGLSYFFGGGDDEEDQRLTSLDISRLTGLESLHGSQLIRLSNLTELILPGQKTVCTDKAKDSDQNPFEEYKGSSHHHHHGLLGETYRFDLELQDRQNGSCAVVKKADDGSIWDRLVSLRACLLPPGIADYIGQLQSLESLSVCCFDDHDGDDWLPELWARLTNLRSFCADGNTLKHLPEEVVTAWSEHVTHLSIKTKEGHDVEDRLSQVFTTWNKLQYVSFSRFPSDDDDADADEVRHITYPWPSEWAPERLCTLALTGVVVNIHKLPSTVEHISLDNVSVHLPSTRTKVYRKLKTFRLGWYVVGENDKKMSKRGGRISMPSVERVSVGDSCCDPCRKAVSTMLFGAPEDRLPKQVRELAIGQNFEIGPPTKRRKIGGLLAINRCRERSGIDFSFSSNKATSEHDGNSGGPLPFGHEQSTPLSLWPRAIENSDRLFRPSTTWPNQDRGYVSHVTFDRLENEFKKEDAIYLFLRMYFEKNNRHK